MSIFCKREKKKPNFLIKSMLKKFFRVIKKIAFFDDFETWNKKLYLLTFQTQIIVLLCKK